MTAGSGVVHSEMPSDEVLEKGGRQEGFQLWVNLPKKDKMVPPRYQDTPPEKIPVATTADGKVHRVLLRKHWPKVCTSTRYQPLD